MKNPYRDDVSRFSVLFTRAVMAWNNAESSARSILITFSEGGDGLMIAVQHLGNIALRDALKAVADLLEDDQRTDAENEIAAHVKHFVEGFDCLRAYRNFYVHSLQSTGKWPYDQNVFVGRLSGTEAKGRFAWIEHYLSTEELEVFMRHTHALARYGAAIANYLGPGNALNPQPKQPLSSLETPLWPEILKKPRRYLREPPPPHESSQASARQAKLERKEAQRRDPKNRTKES